MLSTLVSGKFDAERDENGPYSLTEMVKLITLVFVLILLFIRNLFWPHFELFERWFVAET